MFKEITDFDGNGIGIDPANCGCTDCIVGNSVPEGDPRIPELIQEHFTEGRKIVNRTYSSILVAYKSVDGNYTYASLPPRDPFAEIRVIKPEGFYYDSESIVIRESNDDYEPNLRANDNPDSVKVISRNDESAMATAIENHFKFGKKVVNRTQETLIFHKSYSGYGYMALNVRRGTELSIIRC